VQGPRRGFLCTHLQVAIVYVHHGRTFCENPTVLRLHMLSSPSIFSCEHPPAVHDVSNPPTRHFI
jgi:hypothetical protein